MNDIPPSPNLPLRWTFVFLLPFAMVAAYLWLSRWPARWFSEASDYVAFTTAILGFIIAVSLQPVGRKKKIWILVCTTPVVAFALFHFSLVFVCAAFGDCL